MCARQNEDNRFPRNEDNRGNNDQPTSTMPSGMAASMREWVANDPAREGLVVERSAWNKTGFKSRSSKVGKWYQAKLQVP